MSSLLLRGPEKYTVALKSQRSLKVCTSVSRNCLPQDGIDSVFLAIHMPLLARFSPNISREKKKQNSTIFSYFSEPTGASVVIKAKVDKDSALSF